MVKENKKTFLANQPPVEVVLSENPLDEEWDHFVEFEASGQFEQTSRWAQVKQDYGWKPFRVLILQNQKIFGGFQILLRSHPLVGKIGYLPKGPLTSNGEEELTLLVVKTLKNVLVEENIRFALLQPPNDGSIKKDYLMAEGFKKDPVMKGINKGTTFIDLTLDLNTILGRMTKKVRQRIRQGERNEIKVREGTREDIPSFFQLMLSTCQRQGVMPNPSSEDFFKIMWDILSSNKNIKLFIAEHDGEIVSGLLNIPFGKVVYAYKLGWSGKFETMRPNHVLHWDAIKWAKSAGYISFDFVGIEWNTAEAILEGKHFYEVAKGPTLFKLGFGGEVKLLPEAWYFIKNPFLELIYLLVYPYIRKRKALHKGMFVG
ncbi:MAG: GNAT family N-acetyltransferase [Deltaproteobacteria bacterium]|nr:GNAT family N-acetyltransferase [Deltaproteobacteria bacterium]